MFNKNAVSAGLDTSGRTASDGEMDWIIETGVLEKILSHQGLTGEQNIQDFLINDSLSIHWNLKESKVYR